MKHLILGAFALLTSASFAQIETPALSPKGEVEQTIGLTNIEIEYSRPSKRGRTIFGDVVPFNEMWRTGANQNTMIETDHELIIGKDTLLPGTYAIFTKPMETSWEIYFYTDTENWGTPEKWEDEKVALKASVKAVKTQDLTETFTIAFDNLTTTNFDLVFKWDNYRVALPISLMTKSQVETSIKNVMAGPSSRDYYKAADYYLSEGKELETALEWINKAISMDGSNPFWMVRKKALILAELGNYKEAIKAAEMSMEAAKTAGYDNYVKMNEESIKEWKKK